jgi:hypothetical protein
MVRITLALATSKRVTCPNRSEMIPKHAITFNTAIDLLTHVREAVVRSSRCNPWRLINRLEKLQPDPGGCAQKARAMLTWTYFYLYGARPVLTQEQRLTIIDSAIGSLRADDACPAGRST